MDWYSIVMVLLFVALILAAIFWIGHWYWQRRNNSSYNSSLADPNSTPSGKFGWIGDKIRQFKARNSRTAAGAYEPQAGTNTTYRGRSALDPDEAWSAHVGHEADGYGPYDEEHELGTVNAGAGARFGNNDRFGGAGGESERGRSRTRSPVGVERVPVNPFGDDAEPSNLPAMKKKRRTEGSAERRSIFRENM